MSSISRSLLQLLELLPLEQFVLLLEQQWKLSSSPGDPLLPAINSTGFLTVADSTLFRGFTGELSSYLAEPSNPVLYAAVFAVRVRCVQLNLLQLLDSAPQLSQLILEQELTRKLAAVVPVGTAIAKDLQQHLDHPIPIAGFSPLGVHLVRPRKGRCRFFDRYSGGYCGKLLDGPTMCTTHADEVWWLDRNDPHSTQAKMFRFYADPDNYSAFDEEQLTEMINRFWQRLSGFLKSAASATRQEQQDAAVFFGYQSLEECFAAGIEQLKRRYRRMVLRNHPDTGGSAAVFDRSVNAFRILMHLCQNNHS